MSLTSDATKDNSTYINLILDPTIGETVIPAGSPTAVKVDITEQVLDALNGFTPHSIVGFQYQIEGNYGGTEMFFSAKDIYALASNVGVILDAAIVNEKQKLAVLELIQSAASKIINDKRNFYLSGNIPTVHELK